MRLKNLFLYFYVIAFSLLISSCGGGRGSTPPAGPVMATGYFVDAAVEGLSYKSGSTSGITDADGMFTYEVGQPVTFSIGGIHLGTAPSGKNKITPVDIVTSATDTSNLTVVNIARFLQTIDDDGNHANGIKITSEMRAVAEALNIDFSVDDVSFTDDPNIQLVITAFNAATSVDTSALIDSAIAKAELEKNVNLKFIKSELDDSYIYVTSKQASGEFYLYQLNADNTGTLINDKTISHNSGISSEVTWVVDTNGKLVLTTGSLKDTLTPLAVAENVYTISGHMTDNGVVTHEDDRLTATHASQETIIPIYVTVTIEVPPESGERFDQIKMVFNGEGEAGSFTEFFNTSNVNSGTFTSSINQNGALSLRLSNGTDVDVIGLSSNQVIVVGNDLDKPKPIDFIFKSSYTVSSAPGDGGSPGGTTVATQSVVFNLLPVNYFSGSYSETYQLAGTDNRKSSYTATWTISSASNNDFVDMPMPVKIIEENIVLTHVPTGEVIVNTTGLTFFSADLNKLTVEGTFVPDSDQPPGLISTATSTTVLPLTASIGDSGTIGSYTKSDGTSEFISWSLEDGANGLAKLVITDVEKDTSNDLHSTEVQKWLIDQEGSRLGVEFIVTYHQTDIVLTLTGL